MKVSTQQQVAERLFVRALVVGRLLTDRADSIHFITRDFDTLLQVKAAYTISLEGRIH